MNKKQLIIRNRHNSMKTQLDAWEGNIATISKNIEKCVINSNGVVTPGYPTYNIYFIKIPAGAKTLTLSNGGFVSNSYAYSGLCSKTLRINEAVDLCLTSLQRDFRYNISTTISSNSTYLDQLDDYKYVAFTLLKSKTTAYYKFST